jgi:aminomethyltransferase
MRQTPLTEAHEQAGARMVDFHGWTMPVQYEGILAETRRVRQEGGVFDLCHMGRLVLRGPEREALMNRVFSGKTRKLAVGRAKYGFLLDETGYPIDDILVYRDVEEIHVVINATGRETDPEWVRLQLDEGGFDATVEDVSDAQAMIAIQGRVSEMTLQPLCGADLSGVRYYAFVHAPVADVPCLLARTGYTGEDGFEIFSPKEAARTVWDALLGSGRKLGVRPIGLGARDLLRLEAGMPLYGQEINREIHPLEADLGFGVDLEKTDAIGVPALREKKEEGLERMAVSLAAEGGRVPRSGSPVLLGGEPVGFVTSGGHSPTIEKNIARALVRIDAAETEQLDVEVRGRAATYDVVPSPFYRRSR